MEGDLYPAPPTYAIAPEQIKLLVEIVAGGVSLIKTLLGVKQLYAAKGKPTNAKSEKPGKGSVALDEADERLLQELLLEQPPESYLPSIACISALAPAPSPPLASSHVRMDAGTPTGCSTQAPSRAARQVGTRVADTGRACIAIPPLRHG